MSAVSPLCAAWFKRERQVYGTSVLLSSSVYSTLRKRYERSEIEYRVIIARFMVNSTYIFAASGRHRVGFAKQMCGFSLHWQRGNSLAADQQKPSYACARLAFGKKVSVSPRDACDMLQQDSALRAGTILSRDHCPPAVSPASAAVSNPTSPCAACSSRRPPPRSPALYHRCQEVAASALLYCGLFWRHRP